MNKAFPAKLKNNLLLFLSLTALLVTSAHAEKVEKQKNRYEDSEAYMRIVLRTPEQLTAFYQGREFKKDAIEKILATCYITPIIKNKKFEALWLELDNWQFIDAENKPIQRIKRDYWKKQWQKINLKQAHQATFGWTLMPEVRDLRIDEGVGGSVILPWQDKPFTVIANFKTGADKTGPVKTITFKGVECKTNIEENMD